MIIPPARGLLEYYGQQCGEVMAKAGRIEPIFFVFWEEGGQLVEHVVHIEGMDRVQAIGAVRELMGINHALAYAFVGEAIRANTDGPQARAAFELHMKGHGTLEGYPDCIDTVELQAESQGSPELTAYRRIYQSGARRLLGPLVIEKPHKFSQGRMVALLPPQSTGPMH